MTSFTKRYQIEYNDFAHSLWQPVARYQSAIRSDSYNEVLLIFIITLYHVELGSSIKLWCDAILTLLTLDPIYLIFALHCTSKFILRYRKYSWVLEF